MSLLNGLLRPLFDLLLAPFRTLPPMVGLLVVSLVTAIGMLLAFKATSNQAKLEAVKRQIHACLFEIRLFSDDLRAILRAQFEILAHNGRYLGLSLVPMLWTILPLTLVIAQLQFHYGYQGLVPGQEFVVKAQLNEGWEQTAPPTVPSKRPPLLLAAPSGLTVSTPGVWIPSDREVAWRLRAEQPGDYDLTFTLGGQEFKKTVQVSPLVSRRSPVRLASSFVNDLLYPAEPPLPKSGPLASLAVGYPDASVPVFGWPLPWIVVFFVLSIAFAFALRGRFGVTM